MIDEIGTTKANNTDNNEVVSNSDVGMDHEQRGDPDLELPDSTDNEEEIKLKCKVFRPDVDMASPEFRIGMTFSNVEELRKAINQYSIKNRVGIKIPRSVLY